MLATPEDEMEGIMSFASLSHSVGVAAGQWSAQRRAVIVEMFFKSGDSAFKAQRIFQYC
jgi:hypothetical protein